MCLSSPSSMFLQLGFCFCPSFPFPVTRIFAFLFSLTSLCLDLPLCLWYLFLSQPAIPALLSLILCLVPGQSVSVNFDHYWQEQGEGLDIDGRQVTASLWLAFSCWQLDLFFVLLALYGTMSRFFLPPEHKVIIIHWFSWENCIVLYCQSFYCLENSVSNINVVPLFSVLLWWTWYVQLIFFKTAR